MGPLEVSELADADADTVEVLGQLLAQVSSSDTLLTYVEEVVVDLAARGQHVSTALMTALAHQGADR